MEKETIEALISSINKWDRIADGDSGDNGTIDCNLCELYRVSDCFGCPVSCSTGRSKCYNSPYAAWSRHQKNNPIQTRPRSVFDKKSFKFAVAEAEFLKSLLPKDTK